MEINIENLNWFKKCDLCAAPIIKVESTLCPVHLGNITMREH